MFRSFFNSKATRISLVALASLIGIGGLWLVSGGINGGAGASQVVYLNAQTATPLNLQAGSDDDSISAKPAEPVLLVECPRAACADSKLDLSGITAALGGKVIVFALDPYGAGDDAKFAKGFEDIFITPKVQQTLEIQITSQLLAAQGQQATPATVSAALADPRVKSAVDQQAQNAVLLQKAYPKFYLFTANDFSIVSAEAGLSTKSDVLDFVNTSLKGTDK